MGYCGINHLALVTNDMDKTVRFYRDVLGMPVVGALSGETEGTPFRHYFFSMGAAGTIAFFEWPNASLPERKDSGIPATGRQFDHVSINVGLMDELLDLQKRMRELGVPASEVVDHGMLKSIYFEDPNNISLEFSVWMVDIEKQPWLRDRNPVPALAEQAG